MLQKSPFRGQVVIVTGASSGIGRELARQLARQGAKLVLAARRVERLQALAEECRALDGEALPVPTDVADEAQCRELLRVCISEFGGVDMLINNAGMSQFAKLAEMPDLTLFRRLMEVNFYGVLNCTYYALPALTASRGRIVNIASLGGYLAIPGASSYSASKFALVGLSDALRMELAGNGIAVTLVCPYWVVTELNENIIDAHGRHYTELGRSVYTKRMMSAERAAEWVAALGRDRRYLRDVY